MKKQYSKFLTGLLAAVLCFSAAGCGSGQGQKDSLVYMNYGTGLDENLNYNHDLYGMNGNDIEVADPGCFYVSEEEDPIYGGYYYMYPTGFATNDKYTLNADYYKENKIVDLVAVCYRSKDLYQWEVAGALEGGFTCIVDEEDWAQDLYWAPEVIRNPADGKYYMYFNSSAPQDWGVDTMSSSSNPYDRFYICVAVSDSPMGPFDILYDTDVKTGKRIPTINFQTGCGSQNNWAVIDIHPFFDDNGDFYLYFNKHTDDNYSHLNGVWGMKMKSMSIPDYSTVSCLTQAGKVSASNTPGKIEDASGETDYMTDESGINEAPFMIKHNGKYYLTYSSNGFKHEGYSVHQAVSDSPLSGFKKLDAAQGNPVLDGSLFGYMNGTGHHSIAKNGDEYWIIYHRHDSIYGYDASWSRATCVDRLAFVTNSEGEEVLTANGPTKSLQWLPENVSGYQNLAKTAEIRISAGTGVEYLTDGVMPFYTVAQDYVLNTDGGDVTVTMKWDEPVSISSVMIYNSKNVDKAFSKISDLRLKLAEKPEWASKDYDYAVIKDLELPERYYDKESEDYIACAPAVAEFDAIMVTELQFTINEADRLVKENKFGELNTALNLSEIVVLGGVENND